MRKEFLFAAVAGLAVLASCNKVREVETTVPEDQATVSELPVGFGAYLNRGVTKAGYAGEMDLAALKTGNFGVFAYYTDNNEYDPQCIPNFMYNQKVEYTLDANGDGDPDAWGYTPVKYWPNEYGDNAISDDSDKISFFAYAPYVEVVPSTGKLADSETVTKTGIVGLSRNSASGDPLVKYVASFNDGEGVDLCWGVNGDGSSWPLTQGGTQSFTAGFPWCNVERPSEAASQASATQRVKFTFNHALAKLDVKIDVDPDINVHDETTLLENGTKVYVRSVTFSGIATKGALNLNNSNANEAEWLDYNGTADLESGETVTIHDGRKDGKEGANGAVAANEKLLGLNPDIISNDGNLTNGVQITPKNLFTGSAATTPIYVIPTGEEVEVEIVYDIETADDKLAGYLSDGSTLGSSIENRIRKTVYFSGESKFENGKSYTIKLHLGMNSVKFDAEVTDWDTTTPGSEPWLPANS